MVSKPHIGVGAVAVVIHDGAVLLVKRGKHPYKGYWSFPGGEIEFGEKASDAAVRELREETNVTGKAIKCLTTVDAIASNTKGEIVHHSLLSVVICSFEGGTLQAGDDADEAIWVPLQDTKSFNTTPRVSEILEMALADN